jgi:t-SNARE complex subunit (syntaxin)
MTISKKVRDYKAANPDATDKEIATACETSALYVYQILRPKKVKKPTEVIRKEIIEGQQILRKEILGLNKQIEKIAQLENDIVGYRAVISYLQSQLDGLAI